MPTSPVPGHAYSIISLFLSLHASVKEVDII